MDTRPVPRRTFVRWCRRLDREAVSAFVADLWEARGYSVRREGATLFATRDGHTVRILPVAARRFGAPTVPETDGPTDVVVLGGLADEATRRLADDRGAKLVDAAALHRMALYAVDRDTLADLTRRHFGHSPRVRDPWSALENVPPTAVVVAALLVVSAVAAGQSAMTLSPGPTAADPAADTTTTTRAATVPLYDRERSRTTTTAVRLPTVCPPAPTDVPPRKLRPAVVDVASAHGLEGWRIVSAVNVTDFRGPGAAETRYNPDARHVVRYRSPKGPAYRVQIDEWANAVIAAGTARRQARDYTRYAQWGRYTFAVQAYDVSGRPVTSEWTRRAAERLLSEAGAPSTGKLGDDCVQSLMVPTPSWNETRTPSNGTTTTTIRATRVTANDTGLTVVGDPGFAPGENTTATAAPTTTTRPSG
ncbi:MAG: hypothetical protein ABEJ70_06710 [Halobacteriaceae archaeon]